MYEILHCHTKFSDGELSHKRVLEIAAKKNISVVAFTDHDFLPDKKIVKQLKSWQNPKTNWIIGCELSSGYPKEIGGPSSSFHIIGLFVDPFDKNLNEYCWRLRQGRRERMAKMVKNMQKIGLKITVKDCLKEAKGETVGRSHMARAIANIKENKKIIARLMAKMKQAAKNDFRVAENYRQMLKEGEKQYPFWLFLDKKSFMPGVFVDYLYWEDMDANVKLIRQAGGLAILAHWIFSQEIVNLAMIEKFFKEKRLDGAEIVFGRPGIDKRLGETEKDMMLMKKLTGKYWMIQAGGPDIHMGKELGYFVKDKWFAKKTVNLAENILKSKKASIEYSSFKATKT